MRCSDNTLHGMRTGVRPTATPWPPGPSAQPQVPSYLAVQTPVSPMRPPFLHNVSHPPAPSVSTRCTSGQALRTSPRGLAAFLDQSHRAGDDLPYQSHPRCNPIPLTGCLPACMTQTVLAFKPIRFESTLACTPPPFMIGTFAASSTPHCAGPTMYRISSIKFAHGGVVNEDAKGADTKNDWRQQSSWLHVRR